MWGSGSTAPAPPRQARPMGPRVQVLGPLPPTAPHKHPCSVELLQACPHPWHPIQEPRASLQGSMELLPLEGHTDGSGGWGWGHILSRDKDLPIQAEALGRLRGEPGVRVGSLQPGRLPRLVLRELFPWLGLP